MRILPEQNIGQTSSARLYIHFYSLLLSPTESRMCTEIHHFYWQLNESSITKKSDMKEFAHMQIVGFWHVSTSIHLIICEAPTDRFSCGWPALWWTASFCSASELEHTRLNCCLLPYTNVYRLKDVHLTTEDFLLCLWSEDLFILFLSIVSLVQHPVLWITGCAIPSDVMVTYKHSTLPDWLGWNISWPQRAALMSCPLDF